MYEHLPVDRVCSLLGVHNPIGVWCNPVIETESEIIDHSHMLTGVSHPAYKDEGHISTRVNTSTA